MNFLLHRHLAARALESGAAGHGAMLPDLWRMADRRVRATSEAGVTPGLAGIAVDAEVESGIAHHLSADAWFHASHLFSDGERRCFERFRRAGFVAPRMGLLAHATWELCLDGALVRRLGLDAVLVSLRAGHDQAGEEPPRRAAARHHFDRVVRSEDERTAFHGRMRAITSRLLDGAWVGAYADAGGIAQVLGGMRRRLTLPALGDRDRVALVAALDEMAAPADAALDELLASAT